MPVARNEWQQTAEESPASRTQRSKPRNAEPQDEQLRPSPALSNTAEQPVWRERPDANPAERRKTSPRRWQKSQLLCYNPDRFVHTLVLPPRRESIER